MISSIIKFSFAVLLVITNSYIHCEKGDFQRAKDKLNQEDFYVQEGLQSPQDHIKKTTDDKLESNEKKERNKFCDKEDNCDAGVSGDDTSVKQEAILDTGHEQVDVKAEEKLYAEDSSTVLSTDEKASKIRNEEIFSDTQVGSDKVGAESVKNSEGKKESTDDTMVIENIGKDPMPDASQETKSDSAENQTIFESNSTFYYWLKFLLDPIIEEFKDGIYPKLSDKPNNTQVNVSVPELNTTSEESDVANKTVAEPLNVTETENVTDSGKKVKFQCTGKNVTDNVNATVKLITTAQLLQMLSFDKNETENVTDCLLVMFYAPWCHFCAKIAPYYNALARAFPQIDFVAVDTAQFSKNLTHNTFLYMFKIYIHRILLARFGTVSVPNILVFHQSRAAVKFNQTERTFENLITFVTNSTGLEPNKTVNVTEIDYLGPVPSVPTDEPDYLLLISWIFVIFCSSCMFVKSNKGQQWINRVRILWQEHQHID